MRKAGSACPVWRGLALVAVATVLLHVAGQGLVPTVVPAFNARWGLMGVLNEAYAQGVMGFTTQNGIYVMRQDSYFIGDNIFGAAVALDPSGRWGFATGTELIAVLDAHNLTIIPWYLEHDANAQSFYVYDINNNYYSCFSDCTYNSTLPCLVGPSLMVQGNTFVNTCQYNQTNNGPPLPNSLNLTCAIQFDPNTGQPLAASPQYQVELTNTGLNYLQPLVIADDPASSDYAILVCLGVERPCTLAQFFYNSDTLSASNSPSLCPLAKTIAIGSRRVFVGCPQTRKVQIFSYDTQSQEFKLETTLKSYDTAFGNSVAACGDLLAVGSAQHAFIYRLKNSNDNNGTTPVLELELPSYWFPNSLPLTGYPTAFVGNASLVGFPSSVFPDVENDKAVSLSTSPLKLVPINACPSGSMWSINSKSCELCLPGQNKSEEGFGLCSLCPYGQKASLFGSATCVPCHRSPYGTVTVCPSGSRREFAYDPNQLAYSNYEPTFEFEPETDMETMFYIMCWPIFVYTVGGVLVLGAMLWVLNLFLRNDVRWRNCAQYLLKANLFTKKEPEKHRGGDSIRHDEGKEEEDSGEHGGFLLWLGFLFTVFTFVTLILFLIFSMLYLQYILVHPTLSFKSMPNDHTFDGKPLNRPDLSLKLAFIGYNGACSSDSLIMTKSFEGSHPVLSYANDTRTCNVTFRLKNTSLLAGNTVFLNHKDSSPNVTVPFYAQALVYYLSATYNDSAEWRHVMPPNSKTPGRSYLRGILLPRRHNILRGQSAIKLQASFRPVWVCNRKQTSPSDSHFWSTILKNEEMECELTGASTKLFSIMSAQVGQDVEQNFWQHNANFSLTITFEDGGIISNTYIVTSTSYGALITVTIITVIGIYELIHFFFNPLEKLSEYIGSRRQRHKGRERSARDLEEVNSLLAHEEGD